LLCYKASEICVETAIEDESVRIRAAMKRNLNFVSELKICCIEISEKAFRRKTEKQQSSEAAKHMAAVLTAN
jgi:hypothetical protein